MSLSFVTPIALPFAMGIYFLAKREYGGAVGSFIACVICIPLFAWLEGVALTRTAVYVSVGVFLLVSSAALVYLRRKPRSPG